MCVWGVVGFVYDPCRLISSSKSKNKEAARHCCAYGRDKDTLKQNVIKQSRKPNIIVINPSVPCVQESAQSTQMLGQMRSILLPIVNVCGKRQQE